MEQSEQYLMIGKEVKELTAEKQKLVSKLDGLELENHHVKRERKAQGRLYRKVLQEFENFTDKKDEDQVQCQQDAATIEDEEHSLQLLMTMVGTFEDTLLELETQTNSVSKWVDIIETIQMDMDYALYDCDQEHLMTQGFVQQQLQIQRELRKKIHLLRKDIDVLQSIIKNLQKQQLGSKKSINEVKAKLQTVGERKALEQEIILKVKSVKSSIKEIVDELTVKEQDQEKTANEQKQELSAGIEKFKSRIHELQIEIFTENLSTQNNEKKVTSTRMELANLQQRMIKLETEIEKNNSNLLIEKEDILCKKNDLEAIKLEMESKFTKEVEGIKDDTAAQEVLKAELQKLLEEKKVKIDEQQIQLQSSEEEVLKEKNEKDELNRQHCELEITFTNQNEEMDQCVKELENNLSETEIELEGGEKTLKLEMEELKTETNQFEQAVVELKEKLEVLNLECEKHKEMVNVPVDDFQQEIDQAEMDGQLQIEELKAREQALESAMIDRQSQFVDKKNQMIANLENYKTEYEGVQESVAKLKEKRENLISELERCQQVLVDANLENEVIVTENGNVQDDDELEPLPMELQKELDDEEVNTRNITEAAQELTEQLEKLNIDNQELLEEMKTSEEEVEACRSKLLELEGDLRDDEQNYNDLVDRAEKYQAQFQYEKKEKESHKVEVETAIDEINMFLNEQRQTVKENLQAAKNLKTQLDKKLAGIVEKIQFVQRKKTAIEANIAECTKEVNALELVWQEEKNIQANLED